MQVNWMMFSSFYGQNAQKELRVKTCRENAESNVGFYNLTAKPEVITSSKMFTGNCYWQLLDASSELQSFFLIGFGELLYFIVSVLQCY